MKVRRTYSTCITCLASPPNTWEHIIPEFVGGQLTARLLCSRCNNTFGSSLVAGLKTDPSIRLTLEELRDEIPHIAGPALEKSTLQGTAESGQKVRVSRRKDRFRVLPSAGPNDSLIIDTGEADHLITKVLLKSGASRDQAKQALRQFADLPLGEPMQLPDGKAIIKKQLPPLRPELSASQVDPRLPALIAFEFLAVIIGDQIYKTGLDPIRSFVLEGTPSETLQITDLQAGKRSGPIHAVLIRPVQPALVLQVRFFRWLTFEITLKNIQYNSIDSIYFEDLLSGDSYFAANHRDAENNEWLRIPRTSP